MYSAGSPQLGYVVSVCGCALGLIKGSAHSVEIDASNDLKKKKKAQPQSLKILREICRDQIFAHAHNWNLPGRF